MLQYANLIDKCLVYGKDIKGRNGKTKQLVGEILKWRVYPSKMLIPKGRQLFLDGIKGELAAIVRGPKRVSDFKVWGCNYWDQFGDKNGRLKLDYGNAWKDGVNQIERIVEALQNRSQARDLLIVGWRPNRIKDLTLPCCHFAYQFLLEGNKLYLVWYQRSADIMVGLPSDIVFAQLMLISMCNETGLKPANVVMFLGSAHIYNIHLPITPYILANEYSVKKQYTDYKVMRKLSLSYFDPCDIVIDFPEDLKRYKLECVK